MKSGRATTRTELEGKSTYKSVVLLLSSRSESIYLPSKDTGRAGRHLGGTVAS